MKDAAFVVQRLAGFSDALLARAEGAKVFDGLGHVFSEQTHHDPAGRFAIDLNVKENLV